MKKRLKKVEPGEEQPPGIPDELAAMFRDNLEQAEGNGDEPEPVVEESNSNSMPPLETPEDEEPAPAGEGEAAKEEDKPEEAAPEPAVEAKDSESEEESNVDLGSVESIGDESVEVESESEANKPHNVGEVPEGTREESEFIINDDDFEMLDSGKPLFIREEIELPEYKVITTEEEQIADVMNEIMRNIPEDKREDKKILKSVKRQVESYTILKDAHSVKNSENEIVSGKELTRDYKPVVENILNGDFSSKLYKQVNQSKILYSNEIVDKEGNGVIPYCRI